jgi:hypothetical protein
VTILVLAMALRPMIGALKIAREETANTSAYWAEWGSSPVICQVDGTVKTHLCVGALGHLVASWLPPRRGVPPSPTESQEYVGKCGRDPTRVPESRGSKSTSAVRHAQAGADTSRREEAGRMRRATTPPA